MKQSNMFWTVFKTAAKDMFFSSSKFFKINRTEQSKKTEILGLDNKRSNKKAGKIAGKVGLGVLMGVGILALLFYLIMYVYSITVAAMQANLHRELLYTLLLITQIMLLFLGSMTTLNFLYFSKDNQLLFTLPISDRLIFAVKFSLSYLSQLIMSAFFALPILITYGVTLLINGGAIGASYFVFAAISVLIIPIIPLLLISLLSVPLMYIASFLKKRVVGKTLVVAIISLFFLGVYFMFIGGTLNMSVNVDENSIPILSSAISNMLIGGGKIGIYNYNLVNAMLGVKVALNFLIYLGAVALVFLLSLTLSSLFYRKGISVIMEDGSAGTNKKRKIDESKTYLKNSFRRSFFIKEIKTIFATPSLFMNSIIGLVAVPLLIIIMGGNMFNFSEEGTILTLASELGTIGFICYFSSLMMSSTNTLSLVGFSLEGKNMYILKTLPLKTKDIIISKLAVANIYNFLLSIVAGITFIFISTFHNVFIGISIMALLMVNGLAISAIGMHNDIKNPNCKYKNIAELTKNNKKVFKPMMISLGIGLTYMIFGIMLSSLATSGSLSDWTAYLLFFGVMLAINLLFGFIAFKKLFDNAEEYFYQIEA